MVIDFELKNLSYNFCVLCNFWVCNFNIYYKIEIELPENEVDPKTSTLVSSEIILQGDPPKKAKKLKRRKKNKPSGSLNGRSRLWKPQNPKRLTKAGKTDSIYTTFEQRGTIF